MFRSLVLSVLITTIPALAAAGDVRLITNPEGAEVWLGSILLGTTTKNGLLLADVQPGPVTYSIRKNGYVDAERPVQIGSGSEPLVVVIVLTPLTGTDTKSEQRPPGPEVTQPPSEPRELPPSQREQPAPQQPAKPPPTKAVAAPQPSATPEKGHSHTGLILGIVGGAAAAGVGIAVLHKTDPRDVDGDHDGVTPNQGDCNDSDPQVHPGGAFSIRVTPDASGAVNCNTPYSSITVFATNLDCSPVTVSSVTWTSAHTSGGTCFGGNFTTPIQVTTPTVAAGTRDGVIAARTVSGLVGCCTGGNCGSFDQLCGWTETYSVVTNKGTFSQPSNYTITFPRGFSCQACTSSASLETRACVPFRPDP